MPNLPSEDLDHVLAHTEEIWRMVRGKSLFITGASGSVGTWMTESLLWANRRLGLGLSAVLSTRDPHAFRHRSPHLLADQAVTLLRRRGPELRFSPRKFSACYPHGNGALLSDRCTEPHDFS